MLEGLVQHDHPLTIQHVFDRMRRVFGDSEVVTLGDEGVQRASYAQVTDRVDRVCGALSDLGIEPGDRVATFAWNSQHHLEVYLAAPCMGAVLHTLNIRLFEDQLVYVANHAKDRVVFVVELLERVAPRLETVRHYVVMGDGDPGSLPGALRYEELIADAKPGFAYPELDDRQAGSATRAGRPATPRECSTPTGPTCCMPWPPAWVMPWDCAPPTACCPSFRCSTPTPGASPTRPAWWALI